MLHAITVLSDVFEIVCDVGNDGRNWESWFNSSHINQ